MSRPSSVQPQGVALKRADPRFRELAGRGRNARFTASPERVWAVRSTADVVHALDQAVTNGRRVAVRSGGHCFEDFVDNAAVTDVIDMSAMRRVRFDQARAAFMVEAGAPLGEVYRRLYLGWEVTIPAGENPTVAAGGHVLGGGHGVLCRSHGLVVDHLHAVEVVVVDETGTVRAVVATREPDDPAHELWWAHTGIGGGNLGVVTRYWFRSPGAEGTDPSRLLPTPPAAVLRFRAAWPLARTDERAFHRLVANHGRWCERHSAPDDPYAGLYSELYLQRHDMGGHFLIGQLPDGPAARRLVADKLAELDDGVGAIAPVRFEVKPWAEAVLLGLSGEATPSWRMKIKGGYLRRAFTEAQIAALHHHLTRTDVDMVAGLLTIMTYGGRVNTVAPEATATAQRDSVMKLSYLAAWPDAAADTTHLAWLRELYRDMFAATGGVPAPGERADGTYVNYPDADLADPRWNTSGVSWQELYYKGNHARLRDIKARWDPLGVFIHALSVTPD